MNAVLIFAALVASAAVGGVYFTALLCRTIRPRWYWAVVGTVGSGLLVAALWWLGLSLGHGDLGNGLNPRGAACMVLVLACGCALVPATMTFLHYRFYRPRPSRPRNVQRVAPLDREQPVQSGVAVGLHPVRSSVGDISP
jgi:hypothetical protein